MSKSKCKKNKVLIYSQTEQKGRYSASFAKIDINNSEIEQSECLKFL